MAYQSTGKDDDKQYRAWFDARKYTTHNKTVVNPEGTYAPKPLYVDMDYSTNDDISKGGFMKYSSNYGDMKIVDVWSYVVNDGRSVTQSTVKLSPAGSDKFAFISGTTYFEKTRNGKYDNGERGVDGVILTLCDASKKPILRDGQPITVKSNNGGRFAFDNIPFVETGTTYWIKVDKGMDNGEVYSLTETTIQKSNYRKVAVNRFDNFKIDIFGWGGNDVSVKAAIDQISIYTGYEQTLTVTLKNEVKDAKVNNVEVTIDQSQLTAETILEGNIDYEIVGTELEDETFANGIWTVPTMSAGETRELILKFTPIKEAASVTHEVRAHINSNNNVETDKTNNEASVTYEVIKSTAGSIVYKANNGGTGEDFVVNIKTIQKPGTNAVLKSLKDTGIKAKGCMTFLGWGVNDPLKVTNLDGDNIKESLVGAALPVYAIWQGNKTKYRVRHLEILSDGTKTDSEVKNEDIYDDKRVGDVVVVEQSLIPGYQYITKDEPLTLECEGDNIYNIYYQFNTVLPVAVKDLVYDGTAHELVTEITPEEGVTFKYSLDGGGYTTALPKATNAGDHVVKLQVFSASRKVHEVEFTVTIAPKELTLTWEGSSFTYNSKPQAPVATLTGIIGTDDVKAVVSGAQTNVGTGYEATVTLDGKKASNYKLPVEVTTTFDIIAADPTLVSAPIANSLTYNATAQNLVAEGNATGGKLMYSTDGTTWTETIPQGTEAKIYTLYYKIVGDANHNSTDTSEPVNVTISQKAIDVVWGVTNFDYDELPHTPTATLSGVETIDNSFVSLSVAGSGTSVGNYSATATLQGAKANNYQLSVATSTTSFSIGKSAPIVTSPTAATSLVYNGANQALLATAGSTNGGTLKYSIDGKNWTTDVPQAKSAQEYTIYYKVEGDANHSDVATKTLNAVIEQKLLTVDWGTRTFEYDGNPHKPTPLLSGVVTGDQVVITANGEKTAVGTYPSQATLSGNDAANYKLASGADQTTFDITKAAVTVSAPTAETLTYNGKKQNLILAATTSAGTVEYSINNGTSWSETIPAATDAGLYSVYYRVNGGNNYDDIAKSGPVEVTIAQKELTLTWGSTTTFTYDGTPKKPSLEFAGKIGTDDVTVTVSGAQTSKGNYTAKAILEGSASANYKLPANVTLDFSISGATPAVTAPAANHLTYNGANQELVTPGSCSTGTIYYSTNGIDGWTEIVPKGKNAGSDYEVYYKVESTDDNYSGVDPTGPIAVTIARKTIGIEWSNTTFVYDGNPHKPTATATGKEGTDNVTIVVTGEETESGSDYVATAVSIEGADIANYEMPTSGLTTTFSIGRKPIAKPAIDLTQSFVYTGAEHTFSVPGPSDASGYTITGNRETNAGTYTVVVKLGDNFSWSDGSRDDINHEWSIARAEVTLPSAVTSTFTYDGTVKVLEVTENDKYTIGSEYATVTNAGTYNRVVSLNDKSNYVWTDGTDASKTITFTVDKAKVDLPTAPTTNFIFDGTEKTFTVNPNANYTVDPANASATKIGSYPRTVSLNDADNYEWIDGTVAPKTIEFKIGTGTIDEPTIQLEYTYTGSTIVFLIGTEYEIENGEGKDAGTYSMKVTPQNGFTWEGGSVETKTYEVVILPAKVDKPTFVQTEYTWNGSEYNFNVPLNECYTITGETKATEIADYQVSITLLPNYIWSDGTSDAIKETFKIKHIVINVPAADETKFTYDGDEKTYTIPDNDAYVIANNVQTDAGKYTVHVSFKDDVHYIWNDNSNVVKTYEFNIAKAVVAIPVAHQTIFIYDGEEKLFEIPEGSGYVVDSKNATGVESKSYDRVVSLKDKKNTLWSDGTSDDIVITFTIGDGTIEMPVAGEFTYTGNPIVLIPEKVEYSVEGGVQTNAGIYDVKLTPTNGFKWSDGTSDSKIVVVTINPAKVDKPNVESISYPYDGETHGIKISENIAYVISGDTEAIEPGKYVVTVTLNSNYIWSDNTNEAQTYTFVIEGEDEPENPETNRLDASLIKLMWNDVLVVDNSDNRFTTYQWYRDGEIIDGANEQFYCEKGGVNGSYEVIVKSVDSQEYIIGPAVFVQESAAFNVAVNPNPIRTGEAFSVVVDGLSETEMQKAVVRIYTMSSAEVFSSDKVEHINQVILSSRGAHVVSVVSGNKKATVKILVE
ncbi:MAG: hypothetical protein MJZ01_05295 [Bacteroidales bacterium]|nr:hypothetical protein [Bacteroidales bacterium]